MKNLIAIASFIGSVLTYQLVTPLVFTSALSDSPPLDSKVLVENCGMCNSRL